MVCLTAVIWKTFRSYCRWGRQKLSHHWKCDLEWCWDVRVCGRKQCWFHQSTLICPYQRCVFTLIYALILVITSSWVILQYNANMYLLCASRASGIEGWSPHVSDSHPGWICKAGLPSPWRPHPCPPLAPKWETLAPAPPNANTSERILGHLQHHCKYNCCSVPLPFTSDCNDPVSG